MRISDWSSDVCSSDLARIDQIVFERGVVLQIDLAASLRDLVERRLRDVEMAVLDDLGHLAIEEGQEQRADMRAVDVGVGHDDDLVIAQLVDREFVADAGAERLDRSEEHTSELQSQMR